MFPSSSYLLDRILGIKGGFKEASNDACKFQFLRYIHPSLLKMSLSLSMVGLEGKT